MYMYDGTIVSVENTFSLSIPPCSITHYECSLQVGGAAKSCDFNDNAGTFCGFDTNTGAFTYSSTNKDNTQFPKGTDSVLKITAFTGTAGDVSLSLTNNLVFSQTNSTSLTTEDIVKSLKKREPLRFDDLTDDENML